MPEQNVFAYLHDCYRDDQSRSSLTNVFAKKVDQRIWIEGTEDIFASTYTERYINPKDGQKAYSLAQTYQKEKFVRYGFWMICGYTTDPEDPDNTAFLCSPILLSNASISQREESFFAEVDAYDATLNLSFLKHLPWKTDTAISNLQHHLESIPLHPTALAQAHTILENELPSLHDHGSLDFPKLQPKQKVTALIRTIKQAQEPNRFHLIPAALIFITERSRATRGVLHELGQIARQEVYSRPLDALFGQETKVQPHSEKRVVHHAHVPSVLSKAQEQVLQNAASQTLSLVIGPPGTGKSYTIAAIAVEHLSRGESVLISSRMDHAVDVVGEKIEQLLNSSKGIVRGGASRARRKHLTDQLSIMVHGLKNDPWGDLDNAELARDTSKKIKQLCTHIQMEETRIQRQYQSLLAQGQFLSKPIKNWFDNMKLRWIRWRNRQKRPIWLRFQDRENWIKERIACAANYVKYRYQADVKALLKKDRKTISSFLGGVKARNSFYQAQRFQKADFKALIRTLPIWLVNLDGLDRVLPLESELFDLAIIDEASQCDMASIVPLLYRAKRVIFLGDPNQLRHISFLSRQRQNLHGQRHGFDEAMMSRFKLSRSQRPRSCRSGD